MIRLAALALHLVAWSPDARAARPAVWTAADGSHASALCRQAKDFHDPRRCTGPRGRMRA